MGRSLGIVVPAYDPDVQRLTSVVQTMSSLDPATIRVELDASSGNVREELAASPATVAVSDARRGKGAAITAGFEALDTDVYGFVDADGSTDIESVRDVFKPVLAGDADLAIGSRRHPDADVSNTQSHLRSDLGDCFAWLARRSLPVSLYDYQCGCKAIDAESWAVVREDLYEAGFGWDVNLLTAASRHRLSTIEVPVSWADRPGSTVDPVTTTLSLGGALYRAQRLRILGSAGRTPLLEQLAKYD